jgi:hypothetical protein
MHVWIKILIILINRGQNASYLLFKDIRRELLFLLHFNIVVIFIPCKCISLPQDLYSDFDHLVYINIYHVV